MVASHIPPSRVRWWPAVVVLVFLVARLSHIWLTSASSAQARVVPTLKVAVLASGLLLVWVVLLSRLRARTRLVILSSVLLVGLGLRSTFRVTGVTGNAVPVIEWRWYRADFQDPAAPFEALAPAPAGSDYPQFYGPRRDATLDGPALGRDWVARPPVELWRREVGEAWSSFAVLGNAAVTQEQRQDQEMVVRYDLLTGRQVWAYANRAGLSTIVGGRGPRATPTIADGRVYTLGATGILSALELDTGRSLWVRDVVEEHEAEPADYGLSSSPLLAGDVVIVQIAQAQRSLVAYHRDSGKLAWRAGNGRGSYGTPVLATVAGIEQVLVVNKRGVAGHAPETGELVWHEEWRAGGDKITPPLVVHPDRLLVSAGYGAGSRLLRIASREGGLTVEELWKSHYLKSKFAPMVARGGAVYGLDDGILTALDLETGERLWKRGRYGHGQLILVGDLLLIQTEKGDVVLVEASPDEHRELHRLEALDGKTWNPPALAGRFLLVRNNREAVCYELPLEWTQTPTTKASAA